MFRKPKRKQQKNIRKKAKEEGDAEEEETSTSALLDEARKRLKGDSSATTNVTTEISATNQSSSNIMHTFATKEAKDNKDLVTSTAEYHPENTTTTTDTTNHDGIYRPTTRNAFHAGPLRAAAHVRVTARFDYQPDICKDYKETGFCGYGDTCIYLHDRGDTLSGWQLEQQWEAQQKKKQEQQQAEMLNFATGNQQESTAIVDTSDGIPFACYICRSYFKEPVVTNCGHYFCESCIMTHVRNVSESCPVCGKDTGSVFNRPTKLLAKQRKLLGLSQSKQNDSWQLYEQVFKKGTQGSSDKKEVD